LPRQLDAPTGGTKPLQSVVIAQGPSQSGPISTTRRVAGSQEYELQQPTPSVHIPKVAGSQASPGDPARSR
jgi:hypothetical protein